MYISSLLLIFENIPKYILDAGIQSQNYWDNYPLQLFLLAMFLLDMLKKFNTGFVEKGLFISDRKRIYQNYLENLFIFDILSIISVVCHLISIYNENLVLYFLQ